MEISSPKHPSQQNSGNTENTRRIGDPGSKSPTDSSEEAFFDRFFEHHHTAARILFGRRWQFLGDAHTRRIRLHLHRVNHFLAPRSMGGRSKSLGLRERILIIFLIHKSENDGLSCKPDTIVVSVVRSNSFVLDLPPGGLVSISLYSRTCVSEG